MKYTSALIGADFATAPFDHQMQEFEAHVEDAARAKAWTMRTGKTKAAIDKACHLYKRDLIDGVLIFAPNGVHANWIEREVPAHLWAGIPIATLVWRSSANGTKGINQTAKARQAEWIANREAWWKRLKEARMSRRLFFLAVNSESMTRPDVRKAVASFIKNRRVYVIFDESDDFGSPGTIRTKMARAIALKCPYREIDSGTLVTGSPLQAWSQFELLEKNALGFPLYEKFKNHFAEYEDVRGNGGRSFKKLVGFRNLPELRERMARLTSVVLREDCNMPDLVPELRKITPSEEQMAIYRELHESFMITVGGEELSVGEKAARLMKMQQVFSGFVIDEFKKTHRIPGPNPRLDALAEEMYLAPGKVIVWCQFREDFNMVRERMLIEGIEIVEYHGAVSDKTRRQALVSFRERREVKGFVGHVQSAGRGIDMSEASKIIWYSHTFSARLRQQAMERATKIAGKNIHVLDFEAPGPDPYIRSVITSRIDIADSIAGSGMKELLQRIAL